MKRIVLVLIAFAPLFTGCVKRAVLPDPSIPHRVAKETQVEVWCRLPDGKWAPCTVRLLEGWWLASPQVVE